MRLADFILQNLDPIIAEWVRFASSRRPAADTMTSLALRDHAEQILRAIAKDIASPQTPAQQSAKSRGDVPVDEGAPETAAQTHGLLRARSGFDIEQMASEYRALRASVLGLWMRAIPAGEPGIDDIIRFNEAIDQALAESVAFYSQSVTRSRNLFLGMLGHDMRTPLQAIKMTANYLSMLDAGPEVSTAATRVIASGVRMQALLDDLVEFNRINLGVGIPVRRIPCDIAQLCFDELAQIRAAYPQRVLELSVHGTAQGSWDSSWVTRLIRNLTVNAIKYGAKDAAVRVVITGRPSEVVIEVCNRGTPIEPSALQGLFEPLRRGLQHHDRAEHGDGLGLGLYIAREVAAAHGGDIGVRSDASETVFTVRLPREADASA